ncbi:PREDICTED: light-inducible protein CPRF2-like [Tarenaya hassleriana]|uniref:light-inducible protein CPRF2-like n=1 Tax=Tarenaya hassleriana TaxID=28532 RepID=UPI00053C6BBE|nr:PREDICTED: light-inducible protein CPRF2-like [Tarenaya hassleriana]
MLSTVPAFSIAEPAFSDFQTGFTHWDWVCSDLFSVIESSLKPAGTDPCSDDPGDHVKQTSGSRNTKPDSDDSIAGSIEMNSGSGYTNAFDGKPSPRHDDQDSGEMKNLITGSAECTHNRTEMNGPVSDPTVFQVVDERRKRMRMESNRESARRSRKRKQNHIEDLRNQMSRLGVENRELTNRIRVVLYHIQRVSTDNNRLVAEQEILRRRLSEMRRILILKQLQHQWARNHSSVITTEQNPSSIIHQII